MVVRVIEYDPYMVWLVFACPQIQNQTTTGGTIVPIIYLSKEM